LPRAFVQARSGHAFAQSAFFDKCLFELTELLIEKVSRYLDQAENGVGGDGRIGMLDGLAESFIVRPPGVRVSSDKRLA
jgi:hypothetical protein